MGQACGRTQARFSRIYETFCKKNNRLWHSPLKSVTYTVTYVSNNKFKLKFKVMVRQLELCSVSILLIFVRLSRVSVCDPGILKATPVVCSRPKDRLKLFLSTAASCRSRVLRWSKPKTRVIIKSEENTNLSLYDVQLPWYTDLRAMLSIKNKATLGIRYRVKTMQSVAS